MNTKLETISVRYVWWHSMSGAIARPNASRQTVAYIATPLMPVIHQVTKVL